MENSIDITRRFRCIADEQPEYTAKLAKEVFELCPPLPPYRFDRRMWRLWGLKVSDYPKDSLVIIGGDGFTGLLVLSPKYRLIWMKTLHEDPVLGDDVPETFPAEHYALFYRYMMMDDREALKPYHEKYSKLIDSIGVVSVDDFMISAYANAVFDGRKELVEYIDRKTDECLFCTPFGFYRIHLMSNIRMDAVALYIQRELKKGRLLYFSQYGEKHPKDAPEPYDVYIVPSYRRGYTQPATVLPYITNFTIPSSENPYPISEGSRLGAGWLSAWLKYGREDINRYIISELYKKYDLDWQPMMDKFKADLEENDYYGYTLLREFLTNPMRETPTLTKIGNHSRAVSLKPEILLYIEPFDDSYAIDTIRSGEIIQIYETGHDNYFFTEAERPIESPIADYEGYAKITDGKETVFGYVKKSEVKRHTDADLLAEYQAAAAKSKRGKINDPDGYVNIRKEMNAQSEILGKILKKEIFDYWEVLGSNWCVVKTQGGIDGFVYKDRIKEKLDTGGWTILDED
ncbi:MAG: SH3 domain-containing protein [Dysgonamonadaceae bacterium]|nr:SH3 domain-containing protein [Dysgonamonadaceae bacterium]